MRKHSRRGTEMLLDDQDLQFKDDVDPSDEWLDLVLGSRTQAFLPLFADNKYSSLHGIAAPINQEINSEMHGKTVSELTVIERINGMGKDNNRERNKNTCV